MKLVDESLIKWYDMFAEMKNEMNKVYVYRWSTTTYEGITEWKESTDRLSDILYKLKEQWVEQVELIEEA